MRLVQTSEEFAALSQSWGDLQENAEITSIFETFDWQYGWWQAYGGERALRILVATVGTRLVGILPLYLHTVRMLRFPVRQLRFVGTGGDTDPDDLGPLLAGNVEQPVAQALAEAVLQIPDWDVLLLPDMNPACAFAAQLSTAANRLRIEILRGRSERIAYLQLPSTWELFLESLSNHRRKRIRYIRKKFSTDHQSRFFVWNDLANLDEAFDRLVALHHQRWQGASLSFTTPQYLDFHRKLMKDCLSRDRLRLYCLELSGELTAMQYCYRFRNAVYIMQTGFNPKYSDAGQLLLTYMVESAISEGNTKLDFLRGEHAYKEQFPSEERETVFVTAFRNTPGAGAYRLRHRYLPTVKARLVEGMSRLKTWISKPTKNLAQR